MAVPRPLRNPNWLGCAMSAGNIKNSISLPWLVAYSTQINNLNLLWLTVSSTSRNKRQWILNQNTKYIFSENTCITFVHFVSKVSVQIDSHVLIEITQFSKVSFTWLKSIAMPIRHHIRIHHGLLTIGNMSCFTSFIGEVSYLFIIAHMNGIIGILWFPRRGHW